MEFRTRLIADVVTGKLDVRDAAAKLPEDDVEAESFDESDLAAEAEEPAEVAMVEEDESQDN